MEKSQAVEQELQARGLSPAQKVGVLIVASAASVSPAFALTASDITTELSGGSDLVDGVLIAMAAIVAVIWLGRKALGIIGR